MAENDPDPAEYDASGTEEQDQNSGNFLTNRIGPLPMWGWLVVAVGSFVLYRYLKNRNSNSTAGVTLPTGTLLDGSGATITPSSDTSGTGITTPSGLPETAADQWIQYATSVLTQDLGYSQTQATEALQKYASGTPLSSTDYNTIEAAIKIVGNPPNPLQLPTIAETGGPSTGPPQVQRPDVISNYNVIGNIVKHLQPPTGGDIYITDQGFVYALNGAAYHGGTNAGAIGGPASDHITTAYLNPKNGPGAYTLVNNYGQTYNFGPGITYAGTPYH